MALRLHIGGTQPHPDWKILDIEPRPEVDFVGDARQLEGFGDRSVTAIYASHVLEHFHYGLEGELLRVLQEWYRVLVPGGQLMVSVPNLRTLCWLYLSPHLVPAERHFIMQIMFGGQTDPHDVHRVGFDEDTLADYLQAAGFCNVEFVADFGLFEDSSTMRLLDVPISANAIAFKS